MVYLRNHDKSCSFSFVLDDDDIMNYDHDGEYEGQMGPMQIPHGMGRSVKNDGAYASASLLILSNGATVLRQVPSMKVFGGMAVTMELVAFQIQTQDLCTEATSSMEKKKETACCCIRMDLTLVLTLTRARK